MAIHFSPRVARGDVAYSFPNPLNGTRQAWYGSEVTLKLLLILALLCGASGCGDAAKNALPATESGATGGVVSSGSSGATGVDGAGSTGAVVATDDASTLLPDASAASSPLGSEPGYGFVPGEAFELPAAGQPFAFVPIEGTECQDGSSTGLAIQRGSDDVLIYLEGGGACFNDWTCLSSSTLFASRNFGAADLGRIPKAGIFSDASDNPVRDWTKIFVGYCSGDVFSGSAKDSGHGGESQVGFQNLRLMLSRIVPTLPSAKRVLLTGSSAGGFGALVNWVQAQEAFGDVPVDALSDSGPFFADTHLAPCLQNLWRDLWRWSDMLPPGCTECKETTGGVLPPLFDYLVTRFPKSHFGLMSYTEDTVIRLFYGAGEEDCGTLVPSPTNYSGPRYTEGLLQIRERLTDARNFSSFYVAGSDHTLLVSDATVTASGLSVFDWLDAFLQGKAEHAGP